MSHYLPAIAKRHVRKTTRSLLFNSSVLCFLARLKVKILIFGRTQEIYIVSDSQIWHSSINLHLIPYKKSVTLLVTKTMIYNSHSHKTPARSKQTAISLLLCCTQDVRRKCCEKFKACPVHHPELLYRKSWITVDTSTACKLVLRPRIPCFLPMLRHVSPNSSSRI